MPPIPCILALVALLCPFLTAADGLDGPHKGMQTYVSRPDIKSPKWDITVHDESEISPGYWFVSPYEKNGNRKPAGPWTGPHIYDGAGELIWQGSELFNDINVMDFKVENMDGEDVLTALYAVEGFGVIIDNHYKIRENITIGITGKTLNMHGFHTSESGSHFLFLSRNVTAASKELSATVPGWDVEKNGECKLTTDGFKEIDAKTKEVIFDWDSAFRIPFSESTLDERPVEERCSQFWDYLHSNSIDKFPDGDYMFSARHADTLYKISKDDGHIVWRLNGLGGDLNDFEMNGLNFSRQHHARFHEQNDTHTIISLLDNARGQDKRTPSSKWSRALLIALRTDVQPMTAELVRSYDHPYGNHAFRRGSYQVLPNDHAWTCWSERALHTEHTVDGKLLIEARFENDKLGTYRSFKLPWKGEPSDPPDVHSAAHTSDSNTTTTLVHVSWNGATEVAKWKLYKTDQKEQKKLEIGFFKRTGFETAIPYNGYATYVYAEALDSTGKVLGRSDLVTTTEPDNMKTAAVAQEIAWLTDASDSDSGSLKDHAKSILWNPTSTFFAGVISSIVIFAVVLFVRNRSWRRRRGPSYQPVAEGDAADYDEAKLDDLTPNGTYRRNRDDEEFGLASDDEADMDGASDDGRLNARTPYVRQTSGA